MGVLCDVGGRRPRDRGLTHLAFRLIFAFRSCRSRSRVCYRVLRGAEGVLRSWATRRPRIFVSELLYPVPASYLTFFFQHMSPK